MKKYISIPLLFISLISFGQIAKYSNVPILFIVEGESNSGGMGMVSARPVGEVGLQSHVKILNVVNLQLESLTIGGAGANNLLAHLAEVWAGSSFGFELEIAKRAKSKPNFYTDVTYLLKTGQGGSTIAQWNTDGTHDIRSVNLSSAMKTQITNYRKVIFYSLGINDGIAGTNIATWKQAVKNRFDVLRSRWGSDVNIVITQFQGMGSGGNQYATYNTAISQICAEMNRVYCVDVTGATFTNNIENDLNHWGGNNTGMPYVTGLMLDVVEKLIF